MDFSNNMLRVLLTNMNNIDDKGPLVLLHIGAKRGGGGGSPLSITLVLTIDSRCQSIGLTSDWI
jgi:hypothetical protein